jgi:hypothetical protein
MSKGPLHPRAVALLATKRHPVTLVSEAQRRPPPHAGADDHLRIDASSRESRALSKSFASPTTGWRCFENQFDFVFAHGAASQPRRLPLPWQGSTQRTVEPGRAVRRVVRATAGFVGPHIHPPVDCFLALLENGVRLLVYLALLGL